jgi:excisionase family DNA binding protein
MDRTEDIPELLTVVEVAGRLRCSIGLVYKLISTGRLPALKFAGETKPRYRVGAEDLATFLTNEPARFNETRPSAPPGSRPAIAPPARQRRGPSGSSPIATTDPACPKTRRRTCSIRRACKSGSMLARMADAAQAPNPEHAELFVSARCPVRSSECRVPRQAI